jgi:hypothetical protein
MWATRTSGSVQGAVRNHGPYCDLYLFVVKSSSARPVEAGHDRSAAQLRSVNRFTLEKILASKPPDLVLPAAHRFSPNPPRGQRRLDKASRAGPGARRALSSHRAGSREKSSCGVR